MSARSSTYLSLHDTSKTRLYPQLAQLTAVRSDDRGVEPPKSGLTPSCHRTGRSSGQVRSATSRWRQTASSSPPPASSLLPSASSSPDVAADLPTTTNCLDGSGRPSQMALASL